MTRLLCNMAAGNWKEMYAAAQSGDLELVRYHIENHANPNYQHPEILSTPLVAAIVSGHTEIAIYLLRHGADPTLRSYFDDLTPLEAAKKYKNAEVLTFLSRLRISDQNSWCKRFLKWFK